MLLDVRDTVVQRSLDMLGEWEPGWVRAMLVFLERGSLVFDIGAHIGAMSMAFARHVGPLGRVVAVEPQHTEFLQLTANAALQWQLPRVLWPLNVAMGNGTAGPWLKVPLFERDGFYNTGGFTILPGLPLPGAVHSWVHVRMTTVDTLAADALPDVEGWGRRGDGCPDLMKLDVEHVEVEVIKGAARTIQRCRPTLAIELNMQSSAKRVLTAAWGSLQAGERAELRDTCAFLSWDPAESPHHYSFRPAHALLGLLVSLNALVVPVERLLTLCVAAWAAAGSEAGAWAWVREGNRLVQAAALLLCEGRDALASAPWDHLLLQPALGPDVACDQELAQRQVDAMAARRVADMLLTAAELRAAASLATRALAAVVRGVPRLVPDAGEGYFHADYALTPYLTYVGIRARHRIDIEVPTGRRLQVPYCQAILSVDFTPRGLYDWPEVLRCIRKLALIWR